MLDHARDLEYHLVRVAVLFRHAIDLRNDQSECQIDAEAMETNLECQLEIVGVRHGSLGDVRAAKLQ